MRLLCVTLWHSSGVYRIIPQRYSKKAQRYTKFSFLIPYNCEYLPDPRHLCSNYPIMPQADLFASPSVLSVTELTGEIKALLEGSFLDIKVEGEVSNTGKSANGHIYFTLKDEHAQLSCVVWRSVVRSLDMELADGQQIIAGGEIQVYPPHGRYQLIVRSIKQAGIGALQEAFEKLKRKLKKEGLFDEVHKQPLPRFPKRIGVITSATGAAFHDIRDTLERRWPLATVVLHHASVQGVNAAPELVKAINYFSERQNVDVLIVGRGGGSIEDLWPFNEEAVARAIFACKVPVISAVGHEVDFSISDFVADIRASTPTQSAVIATPDINELRIYTDDLSNRLTTVLSDRLKLQKDRVQQLMKSHALQVVRERVRSHHDRLGYLSERLNHKRELFFLRLRERIHDLDCRLELMNPSAPLEHGYVRVWQGGQWIKKASGFDAGQEAKLEWGDGEIGVKS